MGRPLDIVGRWLDFQGKMWYIVKSQDQLAPTNQIVDSNQRVVLRLVNQGGSRTGGPAVFLSGEVVREGGGRGA